MSHVFAGQTRRSWSAPALSYATTAALRTALERRLVDRSGETGVALVRLRKAAWAALS